jgi:uncharacterized protein involved in response to NO
MSAAVDPTHVPPADKVAVQPFLLIGALYAALMMALWVPWFLGFIQVPSAWAAQAWFTHELVLGFAPAIVAGVLLTIIPSERSRKARRGIALATLVVLWLAGRIAMGFSAHLDVMTTAVLSVAFLFVIAAVIAREILGSNDRGDLVVVALLFGLGAADALFHYEMWEFGRTKLAANIALALALLLLTILAGRAAFSAKRQSTFFYIACGFVALGFVLTGLGILWDDYDFASGGMHAWSVGSIGAMALAVMTCASGAGRSSTSVGTIILYGLVLVSGLAWTIAGLYPQWTLPLLPISGLTWIVAFVGLAVRYGRTFFSTRLH